VLLLFRAWPVAEHQPSPRQLARQFWMQLAGYADQLRLRPIAEQAEIGVNNTLLMNGVTGFPR